MIYGPIQKLAGKKDAASSIRYRRSLDASVDFQIPNWTGDELIDLTIGDEWSSGPANHWVSGQQNYPEQVYSKHQTCTREEFFCHDGTCVPLWCRCDGVPHCYDGSDEFGCITHHPMTHPPVTHLPVTNLPVESKGTQLSSNVRWSVSCMENDCS